ncbi:MAG: hypothetical protein LBC83_04195 [Oscillospiraceae bacterium]|jgi:hypothetical protein|nr:hypothetical protein [Oscillospiraceae bacterium]
MEQNSGARVAYYSPTVEQYRQQMAELARRGGQTVQMSQAKPAPPVSVPEPNPPAQPEPPAKNVSRPIVDIDIHNEHNKYDSHDRYDSHDKVDSHNESTQRVALDRHDRHDSHDKVNRHESFEQRIEEAGNFVAKAEPFVDLALRSGLAEAGAAAAAAGIRMGVEAIEEHVERKREEKASEARIDRAWQEAQAMHSLHQAKAKAAATQSPIHLTATLAPQEAPAPVYQQSVPLPAPVYQQPVPLPTPVSQPALSSAPIRVPQEMLSVAPPAQQEPVAAPTVPPPAPLFSQPLAPMPVEVASETVPQKTPCPVHGTRKIVRHNPCPPTKTLCCQKRLCCRPCQPQSRPPHKQPRAVPAVSADFNPQDDLPSGVERAKDSQAAYVPITANPAVARQLSQYPYTAQDGSIPSNEETIPADAAPTPALYPSAPSAATPDVAYEGQGGASFLDAQGNTYNQLPQAHYSSLEDFLAKNTARGTLRVIVRSAGGGGFMPGANVQVTSEINGIQYLFYDVFTDADGEAARLSLPAPPKQYSYVPPADATPYALYAITVSANGEPSRVFRNVTIFADTESVQEVLLAAGEQVVDEGLYLE